MSTASTLPPPASSASPPQAPLLVDGDRLTRAEFHRRYSAMPELKKAVE